MTKRFVVGTAIRDEETEKVFVEYLVENDITWWHWIDGFWLLVDQKDNLAPADIRDKLKELSKGRSMIIEIVESNHWAGFGPNDEDKSKNMFYWLRNSWDAHNAKK